MDHLADSHEAIEDLTSDPYQTRSNPGPSQAHLLQANTLASGSEQGVQILPRQLHDSSHGCKREASEMEEHCTSDSGSKDTKTHRMRLHVAISRLVSTITGLSSTCEWILTDSTSDYIHSCMEILASQYGHDDVFDILLASLVGTGMGPIQAGDRIKRLRCGRKALLCEQLVDITLS